MNYDLTQHALDVLQKRKIPEAWLQRVLDFPERVEADREDKELEHKLARIVEHGNRVLRVVYNKTTRPIMIVTIYFDRTLRNRL